MQRCFVLHLCKELAPGNVSFPQFFLLAALDQQEVMTMSAIAQKMGHTTAAASGLVARLQKTGYVTRAGAPDDRRKVMVCITEKGSALVRRIREEMVGNLMKIMASSQSRRTKSVAADLHEDPRLLSGEIARSPARSDRLDSCAFAFRKWNGFIPRAGMSNRARRNAPA